MSYSTNLYSVVSNTMARTGQSAKLIQKDIGGGTYDPTTGQHAAGTSLETDVKVILLDYALITNGTINKTGTVIETDDKECYMSAKDADGNDLARKPSPTGDIVVVGGTTWRVMNVKEYNPSGSYVIMYNLQLRK